MKIERAALTQMAVVDVHCHADIPWQGVETTAAMLMALAARERMAYVLMLGREWEKQVPVLRKGAGRFGLMMWVKPGAAGWWEGCEKFLLANRDVVKGVKLHPSMDGYVAGMGTLERVFAAANERDFVIVTHTDETAPSRAGNFAQLLEKYPQTKLVLYHAWPLDEAVELIKAFANVYMDTSYTAFGPAVQRKALEAVGREKILFGIDSPLGFPVREGAYLPHWRDVVEKELAEWYGQEAEVIESVVWRNAVRLLGLGEGLGTRE